MNRLPQDQRVLLKSIKHEIQDKTSAQLFAYSQELHKKRDTFEDKVYKMILEIISDRQNFLNKGSVKKKCELKEMVEKFKRKIA